jgi:foldase protein PrsA
MVQGMLIDQYAADSHLQISDADVQKKEDDIKSKYPPGQFEQILKTQNLTEDDVKRILRQQLVVEKAVGANVHISDKEIADYIAKNHPTLDTAQQVRARHILVADRATADKVEGLLKAGGSFADLAKKYSTDPSSKDKGGELGFFIRGQMVPSFSAVAFSQKIGVISPPVKSPFGWHIIQVEEKKPAQIANMANSKDKVKEILTQQQDQQQIPQFLAELRRKATITIYDPALKDALPPLPPPSGAPAAGAPPAGNAPAAPASAAATK